MVQGGGGFEEMPDFCTTEDGWKTVFGWRANERQGVPVVFEDMLERTFRDEPPLGLAQLCTIQDLTLFPRRLMPSRPAYTVTSFARKMRATSTLAR
jgi:hypothetical protein